MGSWVFGFNSSIFKFQVFARTICVWGVQSLTAEHPAKLHYCYSPYGSIQHLFLFWVLCWVYSAFNFTTLPTDYQVLLYRHLLIGSEILHLKMFLFVQFQAKIQRYQFSLFTESILSTSLFEL